MNMTVREADFWRNNLRTLLGDEVDKNGIYSEGTSYYVDFVVDKFNDQYDTNYFLLVDEINRSIYLLNDSDEADLVKYLLNMLKISTPAIWNIQIYQRIN